MWFGARQSIASTFVTLLKMLTDENLGGGAGFGIVFCFFLFKLFVFSKSMWPFSLSFFSLWPCPPRQPESPSPILSSLSLVHTSPVPSPSLSPVHQE